MLKLGFFFYIKRCLVLISLGIVISCNRYFDMAQAEAIARLKQPTYRDKPIPAHVIEEVAKVVDKYQERVSRYAEHAEKLQLLYKNIAQRYLDIGYFEQEIEYYLSSLEELRNPQADADAREYFDYAAVMLMQKRLYREAYNNIMRSLELAPDNTVLLYYAAYSAALFGKAIRPEDHQEGLNWLNKACQYYRLALAIDPDYIDSLYGLAIILVYELNEPEEAIPLLLKIKEKNVANIDAMFVLAAAYYGVGDYEAAIKEYETIIATTSVQEKKDAAKQRIKELKELLF